MTSKIKKRARALQGKTNMAYQSAINALRANEQTDTREDWYAMFRRHANEVRRVAGASLTDFKSRTRKRLLISCCHNMSSWWNLAYTTA